MGAAVGQSAAQVRPFLKSLRASGYSGAVALLVDRTLALELGADPVAEGVILITARQWLPFKLGVWQRRRLMRLVWSPLQVVLRSVWRAAGRMPIDPARRFELQTALAAIAYPPMESRFLRYRRFLGAHSYTRVLLTDVRDVLFQNDPFGSLPETGVAVSIESAAYTVATEPHNAEWVRRAYGSQMLERIGANPVSCVGVTYGERDAIASYLQQMSDEIMCLSPSRIGIGGADTAIHNMLVWTGRLGPVQRLATLGSAVATFNGVDERDVRLDARGKVLNVDGSEPSVLHQYDRLPALSVKLLRALAQ